MADVCFLRSNGKTSVVKTFFFFHCVRETELFLVNKCFLVQKHFSLTCMFLKQTHCSIKHVLQLPNRNDFFARSAITEKCAITKFSNSLISLQNEEKTALTLEESAACYFLLTKDWIQPYSVNEFLHVEMASHQQREGVPLFDRHGAEGLQDDHISLFHVHGCCGVAVTQVDQPGQDLFRAH